MNPKLKKALLSLAVAVLTMSIVSGCSDTPLVRKSIMKNSTSPKPSSQAQEPQEKTTPVPQTPVVYKNTEFGFDFTLPPSWKGYSIVADKWEGNDIKSGKVSESGPLLSIRHPQWTEADPRQDIPIMVFTQAQWNALAHEQFHIGAAPISPSELGENSKYVFALPARYNYAFQTGYEEVQTIIDSNPMHTF